MLRALMLMRFAAAPLLAQGPGHEHDDGQGKEAQGHADAVHGAMAGRLSESLHLRMTPKRAVTAADSARAHRIVTELRRALATYAEPSAAEADGYRLFLPGVKGQKVYHYTKWGHAARAQVAFDPSRPTSLLYKEDASGRKVLVGGMYTAPKDATLAELDARVPLGIARWHLHTDFCVPRRGEEGRWREQRNGAPVFGPASPIATKAGCDAVGGRFMPTMFNWMVHANVLAGDDPATIWGDGHGEGGGHEH